MMARLPVLSGRQLVKLFVRLGWAVARQRGSHIILTKPGHLSTLSIPDHREVAQGTLRGLLQAADMTPEYFTRMARGK
ncbi:MAG TPA: type II toxin-antitoxin system HicA family toxin [Kiritimatiellia bacterium]|nr:type II toxin-antitoxin system HicA family toxin [Kiritimatiellia bacterium]